MFSVREILSKGNYGLYVQCYIWLLVYVDVNSLRPGEAYMRQ